MKSIVLILIAFFTTVNVFAASAPVCLSNGTALATNDQQVLTWKATTRNQYLARAHVTGVIDAIYPDRNGHNHFSIQIGPNSTDTLEIVYNISFGALPHLAIGMNVEACGDYITSNAATSQYPASPDLAIMHWIHKNPSSHGHPSGYVMINGMLFGQGNGNGN